jgi:putative acetyltransferase
VTALDVTLREPIDPDRAAILDLVRAAFSGDDRDGGEEVDIVTSTWDSGAHVAVPGLELVAILNGSVVGHVLTAFGDLGGSKVPAVAPLAVVPTHQGLGVGSALMTELIGRAEGMGLPMLLLLGNPEYYGRFGFAPAAPAGIIYRPAGESNPAFQVRRLSRYDPSLRGEFVYHWERSSADPTG